MSDELKVVMNYELLMMSYQQPEECKANYHSKIILFTTYNS